MTSATETAGARRTQWPARAAVRRELTERITRIGLFAAAAISVLTTLGIVAVLLVETLEFFREVPLLDYLFGTNWAPLLAPQSFGVLPLVSGTIMVAGIAMLIAAPLGVLVAIYLSEYAGQRMRSILKPFLEILAGIPTVVYGYFALTFVTPNLLRPLFPETNVFNALAAGIVVGIMILPLVASVSEDAMGAVPRSLREGAYALGATKLEVGLRVLVPAALSGIVASFILAGSRAIGETMAVAIAAGSTPVLTTNALESVQTMTGYIVQVSLGDTEQGGIEYKSIFAVGMTLFLMTLALNIASQAISRRFRNVYQ